MHLIVKKPDFLAYTMWDFGITGKQGLARIIDNEWVRNFHSGAFALIPGDALRRVLVEKETNYGADREVPLSISRSLRYTK